MNNIIAGFLFNVIGLGGYYFLSLIGYEKNNSEKLGTAVFWGFWRSLFFTYGLWVFMPNRLDVACYVTVALSSVGVLLFLRKNSITYLLKSEYCIALLFMLPLFFLIEHTPRHWDEFSHWLYLPKIFYYQNSLIPPEGLVSSGTYTPLWTLQGAFFQFFSLTGFDQSLIYAVRINL